MRQKLAAVTMFRGDTFWLSLWLNHYKKLLQRENSLYVIVHGHLPQDFENTDDITFVRLPFFEGDKQFEKRRMRFIHNFSSGLLQYYQRVIFTDTDELLCLHPNAGKSISDYLAERQFKGKALSSVGIELLAQEGAPKLDPSKPILQQCNRGILTASYCKPNVFSQPIQIGNQHRIPGEPLEIDRNLFLFHLKYADYDKFISTSKERRVIAESMRGSTSGPGVGGWDDPVEIYNQKLNSCVLKPAKELTEKNFEHFLRKIEKNYVAKGRPGHRSFGHFILPEELIRCA